MAYNNKEILSNFKHVADGLKKVLESKDDLINESKKDMTKEQIKEFNAIDKMLNKKMKNHDYLSAMRLIQKFKIKHQKETDKKE